jgi:hypothetical protein
MIFPSTFHWFTLTAALTSHLTLGAALIPGSIHHPQTPFNPGPPPPLPAGLDLLQTSIGQLNSFLNNGSLTSVQLVKAYLGESAVPRRLTLTPPTPSWILYVNSSTWTPLSELLYVNSSTWTPLSELLYVESSTSTPLCQLLHVNSSAYAASLRVRCRCVL